MKKIVYLIGIISTLNAGFLDYIFKTKYGVDRVELYYGEDIEKALDHFLREEKLNHDFFK